MAEVEKCDRCGREGEREDVRFHAVRDVNTASYTWICKECAVSDWDCPIYFIFHRGTESIKSRFLTAEMFRQLNNWFRNTKPFPVHLYHRRVSETIDWQYMWDRYRADNKPTEPYSYRGWCSSSEIILLFDETETFDSMEWLLYHELAHHECQMTANMADAAWYKENQNEGRTGYDWKDDSAHEADSEERHVNRVATAFMGGREYARPWWRPRVRALMQGVPVERLPDANVSGDTGTSES